MKRAKTLIDIYIITFLVFLSGSSVLRGVAMVTSFDHETMHYGGSPLFTFSAYLVVLAILLYLSFLFVAPKGYKLAADYTRPETFSPSGITGAAFLFIAFDLLHRAFTLYVIPSRRSDGYKEGVILHYLAIALAVLAVASAVFFFLNVFFEKRVNTPKAALGICVVAFLALYGAFLYFNKRVHPTNSPNKIIDQMAYFSSALFFLQETRLCLGRDRWKLYTVTGLTAATLTGYSALPSLVLYFARGDVYSDSILETVLTLALFIYIGARTVYMRKLPGGNICKEAEFIGRIAQAREEELAVRRNEQREHIYNINVGNSPTDTAEQDDSASEESDNAQSEGQISFSLGDSYEGEA